MRYDKLYSNSYYGMGIYPKPNPGGGGVAVEARVPVQPLRRKVTDKLG